MNLVPSFQMFLQAVAIVINAPTQNTFFRLVCGWLFARRRTVTQMILSSAAIREKHFCSFHRFFSAAAWSIDALGIAVFQVIRPFLGDGTVFIAVDDTLAKKRGRMIFGVGWHHDPLIKNLKAKTSWGHSWVVLGVIIRFSFCAERTFCLPVLFRLYLNREQSAKQRRVHRTRPELGMQMVRKLCLAYRFRSFHLLGDAVYGGRSVRDRLSANCELTSALRLDARLYDEPPTNQIRNGRYCRRGQRLPKSKQKLEGRLRRTEVQVYGRHDQIRIGSYVGRTFHHPEQPLRVVVIESIDGKSGRQAFYSTVADASEEQVLRWYAMRWSLEVTFQCAKQQLGFEEPPSWKRRSVERTAPMPMLIYSLVVLWFGVKGHRKWKLHCHPWQRHKIEPSFADMLSVLRKESIKTHRKSMALPQAERKTIMRILENTAVLAA